MIVVSHDRYFLNRVADLLIVLRRRHDGSRLRQLRHLRAAAAGARAGRQGEQGGGRRPADDEGATTGGLRSPRAKPAKRKRKFPYRKVPDLEADIAATEKKVADLEAAMQTPDVYKDATRVRDTMKDLEATKDALALLYQHWEEAVELNG